MLDSCFLSFYICLLYTSPIAGDSNGMPIGMQRIGNRFEEEKILNAAYTLEQEIKFREDVYKRQM